MSEYINPNANIEFAYSPGNDFISGVFHTVSDSGKESQVLYRKDSKYETTPAFSQFRRRAQRIQEEMWELGENASRISTLYEPRPKHFDRMIVKISQAFQKVGVSAEVKLIDTSNLAETFFSEKTWKIVLQTHDEMYGMPLITLTNKNMDVLFITTDGLFFNSMRDETNFMSWSYLIDWRILGDIGVDFCHSAQNLFWSLEMLMRDIRSSNEFELIPRIKDTDESLHDQLVVRRFNEVRCENITLLPAVRKS